MGYASGTETGAESSDGGGLFGGARRASSSSRLTGMGGHRMGSFRPRGYRRGEGYRRDGNRRRSSSGRRGDTSVSATRRFGSGGTWTVGGGGAGSGSSWGGGGAPGEGLLGVPAPGVGGEIPTSMAFWHLVGGGGDAGGGGGGDRTGFPAAGDWDARGAGSGPIELLLKQRHSGINPYLAR